jgi:tetratricopeptide (TPR) repeat protein
VHLQSIILCLILTCFNTSRLLAQNEKQIDSLQSLLGTGNDTTQVHIRVVLSRLKAHTNPKEAIGLLNEALAKAKQTNYNNGVALSYNWMAYVHHVYFNDYDKSRLYLDSAEKLANSNYLKRNVYRTFGIWHLRKGEFDKAHQYLAKALAINGSLEDGVTESIVSGMGYSLISIGRHQEAIHYYKKVVAMAERKKLVLNLAIALSNLGSGYVNLHQDDSAEVIYKRLYQIELKHGNPLANPTMLTSLGISCQNKGDRDSAFYFLHLGRHAAYELNIPYAITRTLGSLARYHLEGRLDSALFYGRKLLAYVNRTSLFDMHEAMYIMAEAHGRLKHFDSAFYYQKQYQIYSDSVFQKNQSQQIAQLEAEFDLKNKEQEIRRLEVARQSEIFARNVFAAGLIFVVIIALLVFFVLRGRIQARKKEIEGKNWQLANFTRKMIEKSELVEELRAQIEQFRSEVVIPRERIENVSQILNSSILTEDDWEQFKSLFEQVHRNFFAELKIKHPGLTAAEIRIAALLKLNLNTREMANMLGISVDSANKARYRLRKRLDLQPDQDLQEFIENVSETEPKV